MILGVIFNVISFEDSLNIGNAYIIDLQLSCPYG